jgi:hypothetical protein
VRTICPKLRFCSFAQLQLEDSAFKWASFAESTKAMYRSHRNCYLRFCIHFDLCPVPATQMTLKTYVSFLARSIKPSGINGYLNIINLFLVTLINISVLTE